MEDGLQKQEVGGQLEDPNNLGYNVIESMTQDAKSVWGSRG